jgi:hypothetical protein
MKTRQKKKAPQASHNTATEISSLKANCTPHTSTSHPGTTLVYLKDLIHTKLQRKNGKAGEDGRKRRS